METVPVNSHEVMVTIELSLSVAECNTLIEICKRITKRHPNNAPSTIVAQKVRNHVSAQLAN
jgi:hypothetical protein